MSGTTESNASKRTEGRGGGRKSNGRFSRQGNPRSAGVDGSQRSEDAVGGSGSGGASTKSSGNRPISKNDRRGAAGPPHPKQPSQSSKEGASVNQQQQQQQHQSSSEQSQTQQQRNRQRRRPKKPQDSVGKLQDQQPQEACIISEEDIAMKKLEAEAEETLVAAKAAAEEQERLLKLARDEEHDKIRSLSACVTTLQAFHEACTNHKKSRDIFSLHERLTELRSQHNSTRKMLKSDLKKCTAFVKKVKTATSFHCSLTTDFSNHPLIKDVEMLNLSRYVEEIASSLFEAKLKVTDVPLVIALCSALHERYEEFMPALTPKLLSFIQAIPSTSTNPSDSPVDDQCGGSAFKQRRVYLRMLTEFVQNGIVTDPKPLVKIVCDAAGAPKVSSSGGQQLQYVVTDAVLLTSFVKFAGFELLGVLPKTIKVALEDMKKGLLQIEHDVAEDRLEDSETIQSITISEALLLDDPVLVELRSEKAKLFVQAAEITEALESTTIALGAVVPDTYCNVFNRHCIGAYRSLCTNYISTVTKLRKLEKRCEQDRMLTGSLSEAREKGLLDAQKLTEHLKKSIEAIAEALDQDIIAIKVEEEDNPLVTAAGTGVQLWTKSEEGGEEGNNLGPFDDEETRSFYCDLPDLLTTKPPALLGLTQELVEEKKARNAIKYGAFGMSLDESEEYPASSLETSFEASIDKYGKDDAGEDVKDASAIDRDLSVDKETPHYKLKVLLDEEMCECNRREVTDELAVKFCVNHGSSKTSRKRLAATLFSVPRTRLDLLPQYARFAAIVDRVFDDVASPLVANLEAQFHGQAKWRKSQNIDGRLKTARFIGELTKFRVAPPIVPLNCLKRCLDDFAGSNIDVACCLLETCGRYLYRTIHTQERLSKLLDTMMRLRKAKLLDERSIALLESAFLMVNPPQRSTRKLAKVYPPLEAYIQHLLMVKLTPNESSKTLVTKQILRLPWSEPAARCGVLVSKYMLKACLSGKYGTTSAVLSVATTLKKTRREVIVKIVDAVLEELKWSMENPTFRHQQRAIGLARVLGQLYVTSLVNSSIVFGQLHDFVNFGHEIPPSLLEATEKQLKNGDANGNISSIEPLVKFASPPPINDAILEGDEESENFQGDSNVEEIGIDETMEAKPPEPVPICLFSKFDPRIPCAFDPPTAILRIQLVCNLLESSGPTIANVTDIPKLQRFLASFQRYLFTKYSLPAEVKFALLDLFDNLESNMKGARQVKDNNKGKKDKKLKGDNGAGNGILMRYTTWLAAHDAVIAHEEAESLAEAHAYDRLVSKAGGEVISNTKIGSFPAANEREEDAAIEVDEYVGDSDESTSDEDTESGSEESIEYIEREEADMDSQDAASSEGGHESLAGESEFDEEADCEERVVVEDEEEIDPAIAEEAYAMQLQQEEFEREIRKLTQEALEKGKMAARAGTGGKVAAGMVHASQFIGKKMPNETSTLAVKSAGSNENEDSAASFLGSGGVTLKLLKRGHKGRLEAKHLMVPEGTSLAQHALKHGDNEAKERDLLKARVLQYELDSSEQSSGNVYMDQAKLQVIRNRPLSMEDIDRNFTGVLKVSTAGRGSRAPISSVGRGRGRGGRTLRFF